MDKLMNILFPRTKRIKELKRKNQELKAEIRKLRTAIADDNHEILEIVKANEIIKRQTEKQIWNGDMEKDEEMFNGLYQPHQDKYMIVPAKEYAGQFLLKRGDVYLTIVDTHVGHGGEEIHPMKYGLESAKKLRDLLNERYLKTDRHRFHWTTLNRIHNDLDIKDGTYYEPLEGYVPDKEYKVVTLKWMNDTTKLIHRITAILTLEQYEEVKPFIKKVGEAEVIRYLYLTAHKKYPKWLLDMFIEDMGEAYIGPPNTDKI